MYSPTNATSCAGPASIIIILFSIPEYHEYISSLPLSIHVFLQEELDWDNNGVDKDLNDIADHLSDWEVKLSVPFKFTPSEIHDLKAKHSNPSLLRLDVRIRNYCFA